VGIQIGEIKNYKSKSIRQHRKYKDSMIHSKINRKNQPGFRPRAGPSTINWKAGKDSITIWKLNFSILMNSKSPKSTVCMNKILQT